MKPYPRHPEMMKRRMKRMAPLGIMASIPAMLVLESKCNLKAYYGTYFHAGINMIWEGVYLGTIGCYWHCVYRICDFVGWTHLRDFRGGFIRHGNQCPYLNCSDMDCVEKSIPVWFQRITRTNRQ